MGQRNRQNLALLSRFFALDPLSPQAPGSSQVVHRFIREWLGGNSECQSLHIECFDLHAGIDSISDHIL